MEMINQTIQSLTNLETLLLLVCLGLLVVMWLNLGTIDKLKCQVMDMKVINTRFYNMYIELTHTTMDVVNKWQRALDDNKELLEKIKSDSSK